MQEAFRWVSVWTNRCLRDGWVTINGLDRQEWLILLVATTVFGVFCMRGYGSRSKY